jgi:hypothetical protein
LRDSEGRQNVIRQRLIPRNHFSDCLFAMIMHLYSQHRFPRHHSGLLNDRLFFMKITGELSEPLRQFVTDKVLLKIFVAYRLANEQRADTCRPQRPIHCGGVHLSCAMCDQTHAPVAEVIIREAGEPIDLQRIVRWFSLNWYDAGRDAITGISHHRLPSNRLFSKTPTSWIIKLSHPRRLKPYAISVFSLLG